MSIPRTLVNLALGYGEFSIQFNEDMFIKCVDQLDGFATPHTLGAPFTINGLVTVYPPGVEFPKKD